MKSFSIIVKVHYGVDEFRTGGSHFGFVLHSYKDIKKLHNELIGKPLQKVIKDDKISEISIIINNKHCNFLDLIKSKAEVLRNDHKDKIESFDSEFNFYLLRDNIDYVLAVKHVNDKTIEKIRYSINGVVMSHIIDYENDNMIIRKSVSNDKEIVVVDNKVISMKQPIFLKYLKKPTKEKSLFVSNPNIGVIDTETYLSVDDSQKIYALGFKTNLNDEPKIYYVNKEDIDSDKIVLDMVNELLRPKYKNIAFYCHNLSGYDVVFLLKTLCVYNDNNNNNDKYKISSILRDDKIIQLTISKGDNTFTIKDSYVILAQSLGKLGISFDVENTKNIFPYKFSLQRNLFYKGKHLIYRTITTSLVKNITIFIKKIEISMEKRLNILETILTVYMKFYAELINRFLNIMVLI